MTAAASLEKLVLVSEEMLHMSQQEVNYQTITDTFLELSGARFVAFNLYDTDWHHFTTVAFSGLEKYQNKIASLLGFELQGKRWEHDAARAGKIEKDMLTRFEDLSELSGDRIPSFVLLRIHSLFALGEVLVLKIMHSNRMLGDFTFAMPAGVFFAEDNTAKIFTRQLGLILAQRDATLMLQQKSRELEQALTQQRIISEMALMLNTLDDFDERIQSCLTKIGEHT